MTNTRQLCTFHLADLILGIDVENVQEVVLAQHLTRVPLADEAVAGLINLRGQIVTAINLRACLNRNSDIAPRDSLSIIVRSELALVSLLVDRIGDVVDVNPADFTRPPEALDQDNVELIRGAYKLPGQLLLVLDSEKIVTQVTSLHDSGRSK